MHNVISDSEFSFSSVHRILSYIHIFELQLDATTFDFKICLMKQICMNTIQKGRLRLKKIIESLWIQQILE